MSTATKQPIRGPMPESEQWYSQRQQCLGASQWAAALGRDPWKPSLELFHQKRGNLPPDEETDDMAFGRIIEPSIVRFYEHKEGVKVREYPCPLHIDQERTFLVATPDAIVDDLHGLECKSTNIFRLKAEFGQEGTDDVPEPILWQVQGQCYVMGWGHAVVVALVGKQLHKFTVERNERLIRWALPRLHEFMEQVRNGNPPEIDYTHRAAGELLRELYPHVEKETAVELPAESIEERQKYEALREQKKAIETEMKAIQNRWMEAIGEREAGVFPDGEQMVKRIEIPEKDISYTRKRSIQCRIVKHDGRHVLEQS